MEPEDVDLLAERGVAVAHSLGSNMKLASGIAPVRQMLQRGIFVALGTDGASSNNNLDLLEEARLAALCAKIREGDPTAVSATEALTMATTGGARALGIDASVGSIETGKNADIILFDASAPSMHPMLDAVSNIVYSAGTADVSMTMVNGCILMERGELCGLDAERIAFECDRISARLCGR
jgi:5-methylthioadenosine/S-adenosylhomocysteine deaminase